MENADFFKRLNTQYELDERDLTKAFDLFKDQIDADKDKLAVILHLIMLKENFFFDAGTEFSIEMNQIKGDAYNKLTYNRIRLAANSTFQMNSNLVITLLKSGKHAEIHCIYKSFHPVSTIRVNFNDASLLDSNYLNKTLRVSFADRLLLPFKCFLRNENSEALSASRFVTGLVDLPVELLLFKIILKYLNIKNIGCLMQTSKYFYDLFNADVASEKSIWLCLLRRDFGASSASAAALTSSDYKRAYFKSYKCFLI